MKQLLQSFKTGETYLVEIPVPIAKKGTVLIQTNHSLVSLGTERMLVEFGKSSLISKARQQPDKVKQVLDKIKTEGLLPTMEAVFNKLEQPLPLGYCNVGRIIAIGEGVSEFSVGDRVASNGHHAEIVSVPQNLVAKIPDNVTDEDATFTVIGAIGLQGIRLLKPQLGETIVVIGLGLIGLITCQLLKANGCNVIGIDLEQSKCDLAQTWGITTVNPITNNPIKSVMDLTRDNGADGVLITASTKSNDVISQAAQMSRKRGRIVLVGVVGLDINRADFYEKELTFQVSCSYGPGRYDDEYEQKGIDYPLPYIRWTEKRNFEAVLEAIKNGNLNVKDLITEKVPLESFAKIYNNLESSNSIASILVYPGLDIAALKMKTITLNDVPFRGQKGIVGIIGAGNFTNMTMLPSLKGSGAHLKYIASSGGVSGTQCAKKHGISQSTTDYKEIINDKDVDTVIITTRHDSHAKLVVESLNAGKNTFVEKPLALNLDELDKIQSSILNNKSSILMVGFNRRFAPHIVKMKSLLDTRKQPKSFIFTINAGAIPADHWAQDPEVGGGRIIGEACHFIDLMRFLSGSPINEWSVQNMGNDTLKDKVTINLKFEDGSFGSIHYLANGSKRFPKGRIEVFCGGGIIKLDNFRKMKGYGWSGFKKMNLRRQDKGHQAEITAFIDAVKNGESSPIPFDELYEVSKVAIEVANSI